MEIVIAVLAVMAIALQVPDVITTNRIIAAGGRERNPVVLAYMNRVGKWWWTIKAMAVVPVALIYWMYAKGWLHSSVAFTCLLLIVSVYCYVVAGNVQVMRGQRK